MINSQDGHTGGSLKRIHIQFRSGDEEMEIVGEADIVQRFIAPFFKTLQDVGAVISDNETDQNDAPSLAGKGASVTSVSGNSNGHEYSQPTDLIPFYRRMAPKSQNEQVLVITHFYHKYLGVAHLSLQDYDQAYDTLRRIPVEKPTNMKSTVRNVVDRTEYLRNGDRGKFMLTLLGEELVEQMNSGN